MLRRSTTIRDSLKLARGRAGRGHARPPSWPWRGTAQASYGEQGCAPGRGRRITSRSATPIRWAINPASGRARGYTGYVAKKTHLTLVNFGCAGATTASIIGTVSCPDILPNTAGAVPYPRHHPGRGGRGVPRAHRGHIGLITVSIGGNDVTACATASDPIPCVGTAVVGVALNVVRLALALRTAAGPHVPLIGLTYPDVVLGSYVYPSQPATPARISLAQDSVLGFKLLLNPALSRCLRHGPRRPRRRDGGHRCLHATHHDDDACAVRIGPRCCGQGLHADLVLQRREHPRNDTGVHLHRSTRRGPLRHHAEGVTAILPVAPASDHTDHNGDRWRRPRSIRRLAGGALLLIVISRAPDGVFIGEQLGPQDGRDIHHLDDRPPCHPPRRRRPWRRPASCRCRPRWPSPFRPTCRSPPPRRPTARCSCHRRDTTRATTTVVWVVDPKGPAEIAEHVNGGVSALAADATNLYVVADDSVIGYTRSTGNQMGQWKLPAINTANTSDANLVSMSAAGGAGAGHDRPGQPAGRLPHCADVHGRRQRRSPKEPAPPSARRIGVLRTIGQPPREAEPDRRQHRRARARQQPEREGWRHRRRSTRWPAGWCGSASRRDRDSTPS